MSRSGKSAAGEGPWHCASWRRAGGWLGAAALDALDRSRRVGIGCFGAVRGAATSIAPPSTSESESKSDAVRRGDGISAAADGAADGTTGAATWRLPLLGGVELSGGPGLLEVSLVQAGEGGSSGEGGERGGCVVLRRRWRAGDSEEPEVVIV